MRFAPHAECAGGFAKLRLLRGGDGGDRRGLTVSGMGAF